MRAPDPNKQKGELILYTGPMNGGKTERLVRDALNLQNHANQNVKAFAISINTRDGMNQIMGENGQRIPAHTIDYNFPEEVLRAVSKEDNSRFVDSVVFDEINLYKQGIVPVINQLRAEGRIILAAGLDKSFRGEPFDVMPVLKEMVKPDLLSYITFNSYCKMLSDGKQCSNLARYTVRLRKDSENKKQFFDKNGKLLTGFGYAPYFDPLVLIEDDSQEEVEYTAACEDCFKIPYKKETGLAYKELISGKKPEDLNITHLDKIIDMLVEEQKIIRKKDGTFKPYEHHYDFDSGLYVPK